MNRITLLADHLNPVSPTGECSRFADALRATGHSVQLIHSGDADSGIADAIFADPKSERRFKLESLRKIRRQVRVFNPDQIICLGRRSIGAGPVISAGRRVRLTAIHTSSERLLNQFQGWGQRLGLSRFDMHLVRDATKLDELRARFPAWRFDALPWTHPERIHDACAEEIKRQLNIPPDAWVVGTSADLLLPSGIKNFIWACDLTRCIRDDVYFLVLGEGPHRWRLRRFASQLDVGNNLRFLGWPSNAERIVASLDVYVQPSTHDDSCVGLSFALAHGIPLVGIIDPLHRQFIRHGHNGYAVERGARNEIARCVNRLVNEPQIRAELGAESQRLSQELLPCHRMVPEVLVPAQLGGLAAA